MFTHAEYALKKCVFACSASTEVPFENYQKHFTYAECALKMGYVCWACANKMPTHAEHAAKSYNFFDFFKNK
jgi:hypothetical protein